MKVWKFAVIAVCIMCCMVTAANARDAARDLKKMVGYTIIDAATVKEVSDATSSAGKILVLDNGDIYKVDFLILSPLTLTDVIVFAKRYSKEQLESIRQKFPSFPEVQIKLLVDNEAYDATRLERQ